MGNCQSSDAIESERRRASELERKLAEAKRDAEADRQLRLERAIRQAGAQSRQEALVQRGDLRRVDQQGSRRVSEISLQVHRRRQLVVIAIDVSGSMSGDRIRATITGVKNIMSNLSRQDLIGIFS